jgi:hypothetical protein
MGVRLVPVSLLAGIAAAVGTVAVHQTWWGLLTGALATLSVAVAAPPGWATRLPFALGFDGVAVLVAVPRGEGDYLLTSSPSGYLVLGLGLVVLMLAIATLPRPGGKNPRPAGGTAAQE